MKFDNADRPLTSGDIDGVEAELGLVFPDELKSWYFRSNGGSPEPYVYEDDKLDTVVSSFLPIASLRGARTAVDTYKQLVLTRRVLSRQFFPFAVDGGGDYFFVDCSDEDGPVYFYRSDPPLDEDPLLSLAVGIGDFWNRLKPE